LHEISWHWPQKTANEGFSLVTTAILQLKQKAHKLPQVNIIGK
jgi:hypothetical protein